MIFRILLCVRKINSTHSFRRVQFRHLYRNALNQYKENENECAHSVLEKLAEYRTTVVSFRQLPELVSSWQKKLTLPKGKTPEGFLTLAEDVAGLSVSDTVKRFMALTQVARVTQTVTVEETGMKSVVMALVTCMHTMSDAQLESVLYNLCFWPPTQSTRTANFMKLWNAIDAECCRRSPQWTCDHLLRMADLWYHLRLSRITRYNLVAIKLLSRDVFSLSPNALVQLLFIINLQRTIAPDIMSDVERALLEMHDVLSIEELAVAAMGYFKTQTRIKSNELIRVFVSKLESNIETVTDEVMLPILKMLRFSMTEECVDLYLGLQKKALSAINRLWPVTLVHLILMGKPYSVCCEQLLRDTLLRLSKDGLSLLRLKELTRSILCASLFLPEDIHCIKFAQQVVEELLKPQRESELTSYPDYFVSLLLYLSYMNIYPLDFINRCFTNDFLQIVQDNSKLNVERDLFAFDSNIRIECGEYSGDGLPLYKRIKAFKSFCKETEKNTLHQRFTSNMSRSLKNVLGSQGYLYLGQLLPQYVYKDILIILDKDGNLKPIPREVVGSVPGTIIKPTTNDKWVVFVLAGPRKTLGNGLTKLRQLKRLGYLLHEVPFFPFYNCSDDEREEYFQNVMANHN